MGLLSALRYGTSELAHFVEWAHSFARDTAGQERYSECIPHIRASMFTHSWLQNLSYVSHHSIGITLLNLCASSSTGSDVLPERTLRRGSLRYHSERTHFCLPFWLSVLTQSRPHSNRPHWRRLDRGFVNSSVKQIRQLSSLSAGTRPTWLLAGK